jgi:putative transposase
MIKLLPHLVGSIRSWARAFRARLRPCVEASDAAAIVLDAVRPRRQLVIENALLRHQINILRRKSPHPRLTTLDRVRLLFASVALPAWRRALAVVQPDTLLRWHRDGFRLFWRRRSAAPQRRKRVAEDTVTLVRRIAVENRTWGAERIRGEMLKLATSLSKRSIQKYIRAVRRRPGGQTWATFVQNHAQDIWCCDFVQTYDFLFRPLFLFFLVNQGSRQVMHVAATRSPNQEWTAQQIRNATMEATPPRFLIRDRDDKFGATFDRAARGAGIRVIKSAVRAPNMNPVAERFVGSLRRELLDHVLLLDERHLDRVSREYAAYFNSARPHQGLAQRIPAGLAATAQSSGPIVARPVLNGLHHDYRRAA